MKTHSAEGTAAQPTKQRASLGLLLLILVVFAGAIGVRLLHGKQSRSMVQDDDGAEQFAMDAKVAQLAPAARLPMLLKALQDPDSNVRTAAIDPLVAMNTREATDAVESAFLDSASTVREAALEALPKMDKERGLRLQLAAFGDDDLWIREAVASHLASDSHHASLDNRVLPTLIHALDDSSPVVQTLAMTLLRHRTGKTWHVLSVASPEARQAVILQWKQWWSGAQKSAGIPAEFDSIPARHATRTDPAPDFHLTDTAGNSVTLSHERGKLVLLNFWGTWCPPCKKETPDLIRLDADYHSKGLEVVGVALSEKGGVEGLRQRCAERGIPFHQAIATEEILKAYGNIHEVPITVLIDAQGRIRNRWEGERDYNTFRTAVERTMKN